MKNNTKLSRSSIVLPRILLIFLFFPASMGRMLAGTLAGSLSLADEIALVHFGDPYTGEADAVSFSPNRVWVVVHTEHGNLHSDLVQDSLRFYRTADIRMYLRHSREARPPVPVWTLDRSSPEGPVIKAWRWLRDSSGVAFVERAAGARERVVLAITAQKRTVQLTRLASAIRAYDIVDREHFVYTVVEGMDSVQAQNTKIERVGTGMSIEQLLLPLDPRTLRYYSPRRTYLWAKIGGRSFRVKSKGQPIIPRGKLALSPDGLSVVTEVPVPYVPTSWPRLYPPPPTTSLSQIRVGPQDPFSENVVHQYVRINLQTGSVQELTGAPVSADGGLWAGILGGPDWSADGRAVVLPGTFLRDPASRPSRPCVAVINLQTLEAGCVEDLKGLTNAGAEAGYHLIKNIRFVNGDSQKVNVTYYDRHDMSIIFTEYRRASDNSWHATNHGPGESEHESGDLSVVVEQSFNRPPVLTASLDHTSKIIIDPNPELKSLNLGDSGVYLWKDKEGRSWSGGLYKPPGYSIGQRYPLVIQTHGFAESAFEPSGIFPTAFAARLLAEAGIMVLQVGEHCPQVTPEEGLCAVSGYQSAVEALSAEGLVDPDRVGIIGFSRTCFYVLTALSTGAFRLRAASITDGFLLDYFQYINAEPGSGLVNEANRMVGAEPFGPGLQQWSKRAPAFNLEKVTTPLLIVGMGPTGVLQMWEPYSVLHHLRKPVDLVMLNTSEHILSNPAVRAASQGGSVDWFRFWLLNEEDPDPVKRSQYSRWRDLRKMEETSAEINSSR